MMVRPMTPIDVPTPMPAFAPVLRPFCAGDVGKLAEVIEVVKGVEEAEVVAVVKEAGKQLEVRCCWLRKAQMLGVWKKLLCSKTM
jgi:hypothetical protein